MYVVTKGCMHDAAGSVKEIACLRGLETQWVVCVVLLEEAELNVLKKTVILNDTDFWNIYLPVMMFRSVTVCF